MLRGRLAPQPVCVINRGFRYSTTGLLTWLAEAQADNASKATARAAGSGRAPPAAAPCLLWFTRFGDDGDSLAINVRHRTFLRALTMRQQMGVQWRYWTIDNRILLAAVLPMQDGDAMHSHLSDDTPDALSMAAEELVLRLWKAVRDNPEAVAELMVRRLAVADE